MNAIIDASLKTLSQSESILRHLSGEQLRNTDIPPYNSCIGSHIRHILDFYSCIFNGIDEKEVDLTRRNRDSIIEGSCELALNEVERTAMKLAELRTRNAQMIIAVTDDLGEGKLTIDYTLGALLAQANSHTIHHYAIINYMLDRLGIKHEGLGYNPSTPRQKIISRD